ncbi:MAG: CBS domain-containing protein [Gemmatimonadaceae bacterium]
MIKLREIMTTDVLTVDPDLSIREAAEVFATRHIGGAPVLRDGRVVGIITANDILDFMASLAAEPAEADEGLVANPLEDHTIEEAMTRPPLRCLSPDATAQEAAFLMKEAAVHRVLVMEGDRLSGVVSSLDLAKAVADGKLASRTLIFPRATLEY